MDHQAMAALITERGAKQVSAWLRADAMVGAALRDGLDLTGWECFPARGMLLFVHRPLRFTAASDGQAALWREREIIYAALAGCDDDTPETTSRYQALVARRDAIDAALATAEDAPLREPAGGVLPDGGVLVVNCPAADLPRFAAETVDAGFPILSLSEEPAPF